MMDGVEMGYNDGIGEEENPSSLYMHKKYNLLSRES